MAAFAGLVAWAGVSLIVLADGRRGLAIGMGIAGAGLAVIAWINAGPLPAGVIAAGGGIAAMSRLRAGAPGWQIMPAGSTPRLVLCVAAGLVSLWVAQTITTGSAASLRFSALTGLTLAAARILWSADRAVQLTSVGVLALSAGTASAVGATNPDLWPFLAAGLVAAAAAWLPVRTPRVA